MNRTMQKISRKSAMPVLALGALLMLLGPTAALAQRSGGGRGGHSGGSYSGRSFSGGGGRSYAAPSGRSYAGGRSYNGGGYYPGRFYAGRGYYYGGRFWARPYFGIGIGIPFGSGYYSRSGCGYYDGYGYWHPAPCYSNVYPGYGY